MKLTAALVRSTVNQFPAEPIPENHPVVPQLVELFGDHTFFLDHNGLHIVEPVNAGDAGSRAGQVVELAAWADTKQTNLAPHAPQPTGVVVALNSGNSAD
jgi:hypothetical protein